MSILMCGIIGFIANLIIASCPILLACGINALIHRSWEYIHPLWLNPYIGVPLFLWFIFTMDLYLSNIKRVTKDVLQKLK